MSDLILQSCYERRQKRKGKKGSRLLFIKLRRQNSNFHRNRLNLSGRLKKKKGMKLFMESLTPSVLNCFQDLPKFVTEDQKDVVKKLIVLEVAKINKINVKNLMVC